MEPVQSPRTLVEWLIEVCFWSHFQRGNVLLIITLFRSTFDNVFDVFPQYASWKHSTTPSSPGARPDSYRKDQLEYSVNVDMTYSKWSGGVGHPEVWLAFCNVSVSNRTPSGGRLCVLCAVAREPGVDQAPSPWHRSLLTTKCISGVSVFYCNYFKCCYLVKRTMPCT